MSAFSAFLLIIACVGVLASLFSLLETGKVGWLLLLLMNSACAAYWLAQIAGGAGR